MQDSMYSALFGALSNEHRLNVIANNLANVNTTGYKQDRLAFEDTMSFFAHERIMQPVLSLRDKELFPRPLHLSRVRLVDSKTDFAQGAMRETGDPLDVAIVGEGFFKVRTQSGDMYTRDGHFVRNPEGVLSTPQGFTVLAGGSEVTLPVNAVVRIDAQGQVYVNEEQVGQLDVVKLDKPEDLQKFGNNLYRLRPDSEAVEAEADQTEVAQSYLEAPNVNVVEEMVNMIEAHRAFESYQKMISSTQEMDERAIQKVGRTT